MHCEHLGIAAETPQVVEEKGKQWKMVEMYSFGEEEVYRLWQSSIKSLSSGGQDEIQKKKNTFKFWLMPSSP